mgnify:CR=1 FL=1
MQQKKRYVPKEDKEFVGMMLDIARRPGEKPIPSRGGPVNESQINELVERIKNGESIRPIDKKKELR